MKLLLDTHTFIWWDSAPAKLSAAALALCGDPANQLVLSVASLWEIQIKRQLGKLDLRLPLAEIVAHQQETNGLAIRQARLGGARADPGEREQERERSDENDPTLNPACHPGYLLVPSLFQENGRARTRRIASVHARGSARNVISHRARQVVRRGAVS